ncbi:alpha-ketoacid dehydrogenase subunit beta [Natronosalvus rutilus]|uniref:Alpha-ketoacid dehydrogenase subunit beta n=1 Tax=Natronosalvus rutilus TaxID=2953753 RepID=A0A9E7NFE1_9EURY|nr:transketolase C-terminal domain-containing protein [Natronosalvus rutilus]UTF55762.1 alpha-ketoacid dehydrogenase subunit beta [Natronosalvus rutilus]
MSKTGATTESTESTETITFREAIREGLREEMKNDDAVMLYGQDEEDGESFEVTAGLYEEFGGRRVRNTPISEAAQVGGAVGAAATGLRPVVELSFSDFIGVCFDQIMNQAGKTRYMFGGASEVPLVLRATEGAGLSAAAQHSGTVHTLVSHLPGIKTVAPSTPTAAKGLIKSSIRSPDPVVFFENKTIYDERGEVPTSDDHTIPIGEASIEHLGEDVTVVATQRLFSEAMSVAQDLEGDVSVEVIDPRTLYPLDAETIIESVAKTGRLVIADESPMSYGFHAEVSSRVVEDGFFTLDAPPQRVGVPDTPIPFAPGLEKEVLPNGADIKRAIRRVE